MFTVDWSPYDSERVGERRARKEKERGRGNVSNGAVAPKTISSSLVSHTTEEKRDGFRWSLGRKKSAYGLGQYEMPTTQSSGKVGRVDNKDVQVNNEGGKNDKKAGKVDSNTIVLELPTATPTIMVKNRSYEFLPPVLVDSSFDDIHTSWIESVDRLSKDSILSKMTSLTIPTDDESSGEKLAVERACADSKLVLVSNEVEVSLTAKTTETTPKHGRSAITALVETMRTEIIANAATSKPPKASPSQQSPGSSGNGETASDLIDTWYTALQPPAEPLPELPSDQVIRSESVLVPPIPPPATGRIRFLAHNPNAWKSLADWSQATTN